MAVALFTEAPQFSYLKIFRCVYNVPQCSVFSSNYVWSQFPAFITSTSSSNSSIFIEMTEMKMPSLANGINLNGLHLQLHIMDSYFKFGPDPFNCPTVLLLKNILSLNASISTTTFDHVLFVDTRPGIGPSNTGPTIITINNSTLNGRADTCVSSISAKNTTFVFENTLISSDIYIEDDSNVLFRNCTFRPIFDNYKSMFSGSSYQIVLQLHVDAIFDNCRFANNLGFPVLAVYLNPQKHVIFYRCDFINNTVLSDGAIVDTESSDLIFMNCRFIDNSARKSGAVNVYQSNAVFENCVFLNNSGTFGGAVGVQGQRPITIRFNNCHFENNAAFKVFNSDGHGEGGAIYLRLKNPESFKHIMNCTFRGNRATVRGGAIAHYGGILVVKNTSFDTYAGKHDTLYVGGDMIYSNSEVILQDVLINDLDNFSEQNSMIISAELQANNNTKIKCFKGKSIKVYGSFDKDIGLTMTTTFCSACPSNMYSLSSGNLTFNNADKSGYQVAPFQCFGCPFSGICDKGRIRPENNFWGYLDDNNEVNFLICPFGYCCSGSICKDYNSCQTGREGPLCGSCGKSLTENILTPDCLDPIKCRHPWFWLVFGFAGFVYFLTFMYLKEISTFVTTILLPKGLTCKRGMIPDNQTPLLKSSYENDNVKESQPDKISELEKQSSADVKANGKPESVLKTNCQSGVLFPGFLMIVINFYQTCVLYKVYIKSPESHSFLQITEEMLATLFNLRTDGLFYDDLSWCPFEGINAVSKVFFKMSFILYVISLAILAGVVSKICKLYQKGSHYSELQGSQSKSVIHRALPCSLRLILIGHATITSGLFSLVSCTPLQPPEKVLFIDGSIQCYRWWQYFVIAIIAFWVVSFPFAICTSSWLLHRKKMSSSTFVCFLTFPLGVIVYWIYDRLLDWRKSKTQLKHDLLFKDKSENGASQQGTTAEELLNVLEGPFRISETNQFKLPWQFVLIGRRLVLIMIKTFLTNIVVRLYVMLLCSVIFLVHHVKVQPFSSILLNYVETVSLLMLTVICGVNTLPAYNYMFPTLVSPLSERIQGGFTDIETGLTLVFPSVFGLCLTVLLCIRIFHFIMWLCSAFVWLIRSCKKRKSL